MDRYEFYNYSDTKITLEDVKFHREGNCKNRKCDYYLELTYLVETPTVKQRLHIPKAILPLNTNDLSLTRESASHRSETMINKIKFNDVCELSLGGTVFTYSITTIEEKAIDMTLEEIEKKLGHKVKVITKKGE